MYISNSTQFLVATLLLLVVSIPASAQTADEAYATAADYYANGRWSVAEGELKQFLQQHPQDERAGTAMFLLAESLVQQGRYAEAREGFVRLLEHDPHHRLACKAIFRTGEASYLSGDHKEARRELEWFRENYPNDGLNAYVLNYLGEIALAGEDADQARQLYEEVIQRFPRSKVAGQCLFGMGRALELQGEWEQARAVYRSLAAAVGPLADDAKVQIGISYYNGKKYEEAGVAFSAAMSQFPNSELVTHAKYWLGMTQIARRQWTEAARTFEEAIAAEPEHTLAAAIQHWLAETYRHNDQPEIAKAYHERVCADWPDSQWADDSLHALIQLAFNMADHERLDGLAAHFNERYADSPLYAAVKQAEGRSLLARKNYAKAVDAFRDALQTAEPVESGKNPEGLAPVVAATSVQADRANWYYLALAHIGNQQYKEALDALARVQPKAHEKELVDGTRFAKAMAYMGLERHADAITPLRQYLASLPNGSESSKCRIQLTVALARSGQLNDAVRAHVSLPDGDREHSLYLQATHYLAETAYGANEYGSAERLFTTLTRHENDGEYAAKGWSGVGWSNYQLGRSEAAADAFKRLVEGYPQSEVAPEAAMMQAKCLEKVGQLEKAVEAYLMVVTTFDSSEYSPSALFESARIQEQLNRKDEAASLLGRLVEEHPAFPRLDGALYQLAWLLVDQEENDRADEVFGRLCEDYPHSRYWADATYRLAERAASADQLDRANELAQQLMDAEQCDPQVVCHALYLKGQLAASAERWEEVEKAMQRLKIQFPASQLQIPADYWIAESLFRRNMYNEADERFQQLNEKIGERQDDWLAMVPLRRAQILAQDEKWEEAYGLASELQTQFPEFRQKYEADYVIGRCLAAQAKYREARERYRSVVRSAEGGATETAAMAHWMIGESYMHQKKYGEALVAYQGVENLFNYPHWQAAAMLQAGKCHALRGEHDEAAKVFARLVEQHPDTAFAQEASQRLERLGALDGQVTTNS